MLHTNTYEYERMAQERLKDCLRRADVACVCQEAGIDQRGPAARLLCRGIAGLGRLLIALGHRLERYAPPMPLPQQFPRTG